MNQEFVSARGTYDRSDRWTERSIIQDVLRTQIVVISQIVKIIFGHHEISDAGSKQID